MFLGVSVKQLLEDKLVFEKSLEAMPQHTQYGSIVERFPSNLQAFNLRNALNAYGSDKANWHNYHLAYASLLDPNAPATILEIGIGTNDPTAPSSMGAKGRPGASLRAFGAWGEQFEVYGADVDRNILFQEDGIHTFFVDQTDPKSLSQLAASLPKEFDLIIDDGLHNTWANFNTVNFALPLLKKGGHLVIEDIRDKYLPFWKVFLPSISSEYQCSLYRATGKEVSICLITKL